ncbi:MAG: DNA mismatch repair endonuclease MutL [Lachnospiraceae bacterium]|nr:DNA mismatch repair endonuclease MutL [Lachnospiraceae bacterium]
MIRLLDKNVVDKIAAGEVIERPSSVVKELLENSIDSGAKDITVEIKEGGLSFIRVTDNGCGIPKDEVRTAYMRHATSKIENEEDLSNISSLGFRGEALSTIAAVAQTEMMTKTADDLTGIKYVIHGGEEIEFKEVGVPDGTTIVVRNLFFNTPARKKFLKTPMTEGSYINDLVLKLALSHPEISFKLIANGKTSISTAGNGNIKDNIYQLFGRDISNNLLPINYDGERIRLSGYVGKPFISRGNRGFENYFINNRYIKSNIINRAIEEGYRTFVMQHKFPFTVIYIELPKDKIDVNVHPTKMEFKYDNEKELFEVITRAVRDALLQTDLIPPAEYNENDKKKTESSKDSLKPAEPFETQRTYTESQNRATNASNAYKSFSSNKPDNISNDEKKKVFEPENKVKNYGDSYKILNSLKEASPDEPIYNLLNDKGVAYHSSEQHEENITQSETEQEKSKEYTSYDSDKKPKKPEQMTLFNDDFISKEARSKHRIIGQVFGTYWLIEYEDKLYIMDQHAAHEKVNYERLVNNLRTKQVYSQQLMPPMVITVTYAERQAILDNYDLFMKIGYDIVEFGGNEFKINAVPSNLFGLHGREMFMEFVGSLINNAGYMSNDVFVQKLATMACKAAIKGNTPISYSEADALIDELLTLENPYTCPHGRPTIISMSETELDKKFKRIV